MLTQPKPCEETGESCSLVDSASKTSEKALHTTRGVSGYVREAEDDLESQCVECCNCFGQKFEIASPGKMHMGELERIHSKGGAENVTDEVINTMSHFVGLMMSILGTALLIARSSAAGKPWHIVSYAIYGATLIFLFLSSTLHHGVHSTPAVELVLLQLDYVAIFPLIAGTFTPFCLVPFHNSWKGWVFFGVVWGLATTGIVLIATLQKLPRWVLLTMYLTMGSFGFFFALYLLPVVGFHVVIGLAAGGLAYLGGSVFFVTEKPVIIPGIFGFHELWHIMVLIGAFIHWMTVYFGLSSMP